MQALYLSKSLKNLQFYIHNLDERKISVATLSCSQRQMRLQNTMRVFFERTPSIFLPKHI